MARSPMRVLFDDEIASALLAIIRDAKEYVVLVSPYLGLWGHAKQALAAAAEEGRRVTVMVRRDDKPLESDVAWLVNNGVKVLSVEMLHAKVYFNEKDLLVSSMNLTEFSMKNSREIALAIEHEETESRIRKYVLESLMAHAEPVGQLTSPTQTPRLGGRPNGDSTGHCIRCGKPVPLDPDRPLCEACYAAWSFWGNPDYPEVFCHDCGEMRPRLTYERPLCSSCYRGWGRGWREDRLRPVEEAPQAGASSVCLRRRPPG